MRKSQSDHNIINNLTSLGLPDLRARWAEVWGWQPHGRISRQMLIQSLLFKLQEQEGRGLTPSQQARLDQLVKSYKRTPQIFDSGAAGGSNIKPGTRLVRTWNGERHSVLAKEGGFEHKGATYATLSEVARAITGTRWNGWLFFGLRKKPGSREVAA